MIVKHLEVIEKHFKKWYPKEGCGIIGVVKGKSKWFPCENLAEEEEDFVINPDDFNRANGPRNQIHRASIKAHVRTDD